MYDSVILNTPVSSPLHPQANLQLLKGYLASHGFKTKTIDSNILFFNWFINGHKYKLSLGELENNPLAILESYDEIEKKLHEKSNIYEGLDVGIRYLSMKYDRTDMDQVVAAVMDKSANPFIEFYSQLVEREIKPLNPKILGIAITFQDQIIPAFTLADLARKLLPDVRIVMGGQIVTRCYESMVAHERLAGFFDYLALWEGEKPLLDIHREVIKGERSELVNVIKMEGGKPKIERQANAPESGEIPLSDISDIDLGSYYYPDLLIPLQTTRGCYAKCDFCAIPFGANSYRVRSVEDIISDIKNIQSRTLELYGRKAVFFKFMEDTSSPALLHELSMEIEKQKLDVKWETFARLEKTFAKPGFMEQLYRGGCRKIHWGLESNDPAILSSMNKKTTASYADQVLGCSAKAGVLNFCFILVGFPGETNDARKNMADYIIGNRNIHTITISTFDLTRGAPMEREFRENNEYGLSMKRATGFQVRLPYTINGENWKASIVSAAHRMMLDIVRKRMDIGFMTLFPDQIRSFFCDRFGNNWGQVFLERYGEEGIRDMLLNTEKYVKAYEEKKEISPDLLPEPLRREHFRTKEDMKLIASALISRKQYESRRIRQV